MKDVMSIKERKEIMDRLLSLSKIYECLTSRAGEIKDFEATKSEQSDIRQQMTQVSKNIEIALSQYLRGLPLRHISRCPFSGEVLSMFIDDFGLDGLWWNYNSPKRPNNTFPKTFYAMDGALKLNGNPELMPFLCCPGPDVPFVLPELLEFTQVRAVISSIKIGSHTAYPVFYFADPMLYGEEMVNDWGTGRYWEEGSILPGILSSGQYVSNGFNSKEYDFDLKRWLRRGKLLWIAPGDTSLTLRSHVVQCPYLNLTGSRNIKYIQNGIVWEEDFSYEMEEQDDFDFNLEHFMAKVNAIELEDI